MTTLLLRSLPLCALALLLGACAKGPGPEADAPRTHAEAEPELALEATPHAEPDDEADDASASWVSPFPGIRVNTADRVVEVESYVSPLIHSGLDGENYYLEQFVCVPNTKEHESLLVTRARPSHIHAALLLLDLEPGRPVTWDDAGGVVPARGPRVAVRFRYDDATGRTVTVHPGAWTKSTQTGEPMPERAWRFSGSTIRRNAGREFYEADSAGTVIGLASFGGETLSWPDYISDLEDSGDLEWLARTGVMPPAQTPVTIVISPAR